MNYHLHEGSPGQESMGVTLSTLSTLCAYKLEDHCYASPVAIPPVKFQNDFYLFLYGIENVFQLRRSIATVNCVVYPYLPEPSSIFLHSYAFSFFHVSHRAVLRQVNSQCQSLERRSHPNRFLMMKGKHISTRLL